VQAEDNTGTGVFRRLRVMAKDHEVQTFKRTAGFMRTTIAFVLSFSIMTGAQAQTPGTGNNLGQLTLEQLLEVRVIVAARRDQPLGESPRSITVITKEEIWRSNYRTTPEALADSVGVLVPHTSYAGGAPIVRGLVGTTRLAPGDLADPRIPPGGTPGFIAFSVDAAEQSGLRLSSRLLGLAEVIRNDHVQ
jgi:outer membrane receptor protein involved in Fe transport